MSGVVVLVGDRDADPLVPALEAELTARHLPARTVSPAALAATRLACGGDWCAIDGAPVAAVVFRASPMLLVAPGFGEDDAGFAASELRAVWAHVLAIPGVPAVNRAYADSWLSSSEWSFWRRRLAAGGVAVAPRRIGRPHAEGRWIRWTGGDEPSPDARAAERLGVASVACGTLTRMLCCVGETIDGDRCITSVAAALLREGLVLAEALLDEEGRLVGVETVPAVPPVLAGELSSRLAGWIGAALGG